MTDIFKNISELHAGTWIAIGSLAVSIGALIVAGRRQTFDRRLLGAQKITEIKTILFDYRRIIADFRKAVDEWEQKCKTCEMYPEDNFKSYRKTAEDYLARNEGILKRIGERPKDNTAVTLETITADINDLRQDLVDIVARIRMSVQHCTKDEQTK